MDNRFEFEVVKVSIKREGNYEDIETEEIVTSEKDREIAIYEFFYYLSYEDRSQDVIMLEEI